MRAGLVVASGSATHVGLRRALNEDSFLAEAPVFLVADGMGGHEAGEVASAKVVEALGQLPESPHPDEVADLAVTALKRVNQELVELAFDGIEQKTIGSTVVGLAIGDGQYRCFWAGDSRAYRIRDGKMTQLTRDHSLVSDAAHMAPWLSEEEVAQLPPNVITRALGIREDVAVDLFTEDTKLGDVYLLCSDGLCGTLSDDQMRDGSIIAGPRAGSEVRRNGEGILRGIRTLCRTGAMSSERMSRFRLGQRKAYVYDGPRGRIGRRTGAAATTAIPRMPRRLNAGRYAHAAAAGQATRRWAISPLRLRN